MHTELYAMVTQVQRLIENLEYTVLEAFGTDYSNMTIARVNEIAEDTTEFALYGAHVPLAASLPGETYNYISIQDDYTKIISATKFVSAAATANSSTISCGFADEEVVVPSTFQQENEGIFDCSFVKNTIDTYQPLYIVDGDGRGLDNKFIDASNLVSIIIYEDYGGSRDALQHETGQCDPFLITITATDKSILDNNGKLVYALLDGDGDDDDNQAFPGCNFWNTSQDIWDQFDCFVYNFTPDGLTVTCGCLHLTTFKLSKNDFNIKANIIANGIGET